MILRRLTEHVRTQNWFAVTLDFLIVVLGVFIGLQVQEWSSARAERARVTAQLSSVYTELVLSRDYINERIEYYSDRVDDAKELRLQLALETSELTEDDFNRLAFSTLRSGSLDIPYSSFDELSASGAMSLIDDSELRSLLLRWDNLLARIHSSDESVEQFRAVAVVPVFNEAFVLGNGFRTDERFPDFTYTDRFAFDLDKIRMNVGLDNAIAIRQATAQQQLNFVHELSAITEELITALESATQ